MSADDAVSLVRVRHDLCQAWRGHLLSLGAIEVSTPVLHRRPDIAPVRQFTTAHPTTGQSSYLRIAPTEHLKRLIADGQEDIFEFAVNFRDDVADETHLPEFTSLEVMVRGATCADMEQLTIALCALAVEVAHQRLGLDGTPPWVQEWSQHPSGPVERLDLAHELLVQFALHSTDLRDSTRLARGLAAAGVSVAAGATLAQMLDALVTLIAASRRYPVLICGFPTDLGGPAAADTVRSGFKQRSEMFINGIEVANMSSNLTDAAALRSWHVAGTRLKKDLKIASTELDDDLLSELDGRLPESAVLGIGVERILQLVLGLTDIRALRHDPILEPR